MQTAESLRRTLSVTEELHAVVKTMKALAGVNIRQYERAVRAVTEYNSAVEMGLQIALRRFPEYNLNAAGAHAEKLGAMVFGSDQGMCGQLNDQVVHFASRALGKLARRHPEQFMVAAGLRAASQLDAQLEPSGRKVEKCVEAPNSVSGILTAVEEALRVIEDWRFGRGVNLVVLFYAHPVSGAWYRVRGVRLLPLDREWIHSLKTRPWPTASIPTFTMLHADLFGALIREYLFVSLFRAFAESLASENASRLASMQVAERNIEERLRALVHESRQLRQTTITSELLDIISAYEALNDPKRGERRT
jgi:F-type H+-transporting ATPase subunit gamma